MKGDYEVGRGKPPRHTRFKKGQSGNPKGRPRGSENHYTLLNRVLNERVVVIINGRRKTITKHRAVVMQIVNRAMAGEYRYSLLLFKMQPPSEQFEEGTSQFAQPQYSNEKRQSIGKEVLEILIQCGAIKLPEGMIYKSDVVDASARSLPGPAPGPAPDLAERLSIPQPLPE